MVFREPLADPVRMRLALGQRLGLLPAPAESLRLAVERFGPRTPAVAPCSTTAPLSAAPACGSHPPGAAVAGRGGAARVTSIRTLACPSAARCSRRSSCERAPVSPGARRLAVPRPTTVLVGPGGRPLAVDRHEVVAVRESWLIEDRWWTERPLRRRYWEARHVDGRDLVVFRDLRRVGGTGTGESAPSQARPARPAPRRSRPAGNSITRSSAPGRDAGIRLRACRWSPGRRPSGCDSAGGDPRRALFHHASARYALGGLALDHDVVADIELHGGPPFVVS